MDVGNQAFHAFPMGKAPKRGQKGPAKTWRPLFIVEWLEHLGHTQTWLADQTGYDESYISLVAAGKKRYNQDLVEAFAEAMHITPAMLHRKPAEKDVWEIWEQLTPEEREQATRHLAAIKPPPA